MAAVYRSMINEGGKPKVGTDANMLGARVPPLVPSDIQPEDNAESTVHPETGGISVAKAWKKLPPGLIPTRLRTAHPAARGSDSFAIFRYMDQEFESGTLAAGLYLRWGPKTHGEIEPEIEMPLAAYQEALAATRDGWSVREDEK